MTTLWDMRQAIESAIPLEYYIAFVVGVLGFYAALILYKEWRARK